MKKLPVFAICVEYTLALSRDIVDHFKDCSMLKYRSVFNTIFRSRNSVFFGLKTWNKCNNRKFSGSYLATLFSIALGTSFCSDLQFKKGTKGKKKKMVIAVAKKKKKTTVKLNCVMQAAKYRFNFKHSNLRVTNGFHCLNS